MLIVIAFGYRIACEKDADECEHHCHADDAKYDDQRIGLPLNRGEGRQHYGVKRDRRQQDPPARANFLTEVSEDPCVNDHVHHEVEEGAEGGDAAEIKEDRQEACDHNGVDQRVILDRAGHPEWLCGITFIVVSMASIRDTAKMLAIRPEAVATSASATVR